MTIIEVLKSLAEGQKFRRSSGGSLWGLTELGSVIHLESGELGLASSGALLTDDWELVPLPPTLRAFSDALAMLVDSSGRRMRREGWKTSWVTLYRFKDYSILLLNDSPTPIVVEHFLANDWIVE